MILGLFYYPSTFILIYCYEKLQTFYPSNMSKKPITAYFTTQQSNEQTTPTSVLSSPPRPSKKEDKRFTFLVDIRDKNKRAPTDPEYDPTTLYIDPKDFNKLTPFEKQFWEIKQNYFNTIIFFKKGKFYELYEDDAIIANREFGLRISDRVNMKMAGVPESSYEYWINKFIEKGYVVGRVEQAENMLAKNMREKEEEDAKRAKIVDSFLSSDNRLRQSKEDKIIKRELKEIITPATIYNYEELKTAFPVYLAVLRENTTSHEYSIILFDATTNTVIFKSFENLDELNNLVAQYKIVEILTEVKHGLKIKTTKPIKGNSCIRFTDSFDNENEYQCFLHLLNYMQYLKRESFIDSVIITKMHAAGAKNMCLDRTTVKNLELIENSENKKTLFDTLNFCITSQGKRELQKWILFPLTDRLEIKNRQNAIAALEKIDTTLLRDSLKSIGDIERIIGRLFGDNPVLKDLMSFMDWIQKSVDFVENFNLLLLQNYGCEDEKLRLLCANENKENTEYTCHRSIEPFSISSDSTKQISNEISVRHLLDHLKGFPDLTEFFENFKSNYELKKEEIIVLSKDHIVHKCAKNLCDIETSLNMYLEDQKSILNDRTIAYKDLGKEIYQIEVKDGTKIPSNYFLVSSTKTTKRYYTNELKIMVNEYKETQERLFQSKGNLLRDVVNELKPNIPSFYVVSNIIGTMDCFLSLSTYQRINTLGVLPEFTENTLEFEGMKNPVYKNFVGNDIVLANKILILTGPNMGGKTTLLRTAGLNIIMAQMGLKVHCKKMKTKIFDQIYTRIGANDDLLKGESTFMVELSETSKILNNCTNDSFLIIDELGRGTSTKDGECIARSVINYLQSKNVYCMFSTHYHSMVNKIHDVTKGYMKAVVNDEDLFFMYKLCEGVCYDSLGIEVAKLAKVNEEIIERARCIKKELEK